jgi:predicted RNA-binding protein with PIN domain
MRREDSLQPASRSRYLIVDGHSIVFAWPDLRKLHQRRTVLARDALAKRLRDYQDWTGIRVVLVFDGAGDKVSAHSDPHDIQVMYSRKGQTADSIVERLAAKYAPDFDVTVATSDLLERQTVTAFGASSISPKMLQEMLGEAAREDEPRARKSRRAR